MKKRRIIVAMVCILSMIFTSFTVGASETALPGVQAASTNIEWVVFDTNRLELQVDDIVQLSARVLPYTADQRLQFSSDNSCVEVNGYGTNSCYVYAKSEGTATITARATNYVSFDICIVTVKAKSGGTGGGDNGGSNGGYIKPEGNSLILSTKDNFEASTRINRGSYKYRKSDLQQMKLHDNICSVYVPAGYRLILCEDDNYKGYIYSATAGAFGLTVPVLPSGIRKKTSSIIYEKISEDPIYPTFYKDSGYNGTKLTLGSPGQYRKSQLSPVGNDNISSLKVPPGYKVTIFEDDNFKGRSVTYTNLYSPPWLGSMNDKTSSIIIERI